MDLFDKPKFEIQYYFKHMPSTKWKMYVRANSEEEALQRLYCEFSPDGIHVEKVIRQK